MATFAIGDIQGCYESLLGLLRKIEARDDDEIWLVGDLVNRGPRSADVLRWAKAQGDRVVAVMGNHDLHLLSMSLGLREPKYRDTAHEVLEAPDREELIDWLRRRPLMHRGPQGVMVHAGLHPDWSVDEAFDHAAEIEEILARADWGEHFASVHGGKSPTKWRDSMSGADRWQAITTILTKVRCLQKRSDDDWRLDHRFFEHPSHAEDDLVPWYDARKADREHIVFGHWAALGLLQREDVTATDTGCVWGRCLTAVRLEDGRVFEQPALE